MTTTTQPESISNLQQNSQKFTNTYSNTNNSHVEEAKNINNSESIIPPPSTDTTNDPEPLVALDGRVWVALTHAPLDVLGTIARVKDPSAGAVVMFAGTTRNTFLTHRVSTLHYTAYAPLALRTLLNIGTAIHSTHSLVRLAIIHRLGTVPVGEESILICVSSKHRGEAWRAGEEALERVKESVEVWKLEEFLDEGEGNERRVWRANRDGKAGEWVDGKANGEREEGSGDGVVGGERLVSK